MRGARGVSVRERMGKRENEWGAFLVSVVMHYVSEMGRPAGKSI